ncbi:MAG: FprA family A-type flavoprotein [Lachnospiraceae bacterium]|nr:FprA family A-type flavoprotein [Lachnospiraceae bacterium]
MNKKVTEDIFYVGVDDTTIDLFESQYVVPEGISYNSYVILDEKIAIMDTADQRKIQQWFENVKEVLGERTPEYLVVSHMEPDHASGIQKLTQEYPKMQVVGNSKTFQMYQSFFQEDLSDRAVMVKEGDTLSLGSHELNFVMAPMVHWPEVMVAYDSKDKILFSADGFGKFGALNCKERPDESQADDWACEARRYYFNIVGKYGMQVQNLLKKAAALDIQMICPLHGPVLTENLGYYIDKYNTWSSYQPEDSGILIAYASIHGNTKKAALRLAEILGSKTKVVVSDLSREDMAEVIEDAFRYDRMVVAAPTYDAGVFPVMEDFLRHLKSKAYQKRKVGVIENGSWAPMSGKIMTGILSEMREISLLNPVVTIKSSLNQESEQALQKLAEELLSDK